ncbi:MAG: 50S ribosomal protein L24 [Spirochaetes bacterium]|nr:MAG: 50S ribosomal protein L24 [Spirochaetota bacterium]
MKEKMKTRIRKDDTVKILTGKEKGKTGRVLKVDRVAGRVIVQGLNMVKKATKQKSQQDKGGIIEIEAPLHISNVAMTTKSGQVTKIGYKFENGKKVRFARKNGEVL